ncbi:hypothetical protein [Phaeobacter sp. 22II1-1F12B]|nr:hypothetical protein [Phaeobacter sp. 22II1-1F12B]
MKNNNRFIKSVVAAARNSETSLPWSRGSNRAAMIASRAEVETSKRRSA